PPPARAPPALPTRRASDLGGGQAEEDERSSPVAVRAPPRDRRNHRCEQRCHEKSRPHPRLGEPACSESERHEGIERTEDHPGQEDRKSTRLNSSHQISSYA